MVFDATVNLLRLFGSKVANGTIDELQTRLNRAATNVFDLTRIVDALDMFVGTKRQVRVVDPFDSRLRHVFPNKLRQVAADLVRERQLSIGKRARARKARRNATWLASDAMAHFRLRTIAPLDGKALLHKRNGRGRCIFQKRQRRENTRGTGTHDNDIDGHI